MASNPAVAAAESATATLAVDLEPDLVGDVFFSFVRGSDVDVDDDVADVDVDVDVDPEADELELAELVECSE